MDYEMIDYDGYEIIDATELIDEETEQKLDDFFRDLLEEN